jgi:hypothetical protein
MQLHAKEQHVNLLSHLTLRYDLEHWPSQTALAWQLCRALSKLAQQKLNVALVTWVRTLSGLSRCVTLTTHCSVLETHSLAFSRCVLHHITLYIKQNHSTMYWHLPLICIMSHLLNSNHSSLISNVAPLISTISTVRISVSIKSVI